MSRSLLLRLVKHDFAKLRAERDAKIQAVFESFCKEHGWDIKKASMHVSGTSGCYCACPTGPCEHEFQGWRDIIGDNGDCQGGEQFCSKCGLGSMSHSMRTAL